MSQSPKHSPTSGEHPLSSFTKATSAGAVNLLFSGMKTCLGVLSALAKAYIEDLERIGIRERARRADGKLSGRKKSKLPG